MNGGETGERSLRRTLFPLGFLTVTLANLMELRWRMEGEDGEEAVKMERDLVREGSEKEGEEVGLG